jgi:hypothetical protein
MEYFMRRIFQLSVASLAVSVVAGCSDRKEVTETGYFPSGGVRFINAVNDTAGSGGVDFRFVDIVENNAHYNIQFRNNVATSGTVAASTQIQYKNTRAGARHFNIFLDDTLPSVASTVLQDGNLTVEDQHNYTMLLWGRARAGQTPAMALKVIDETSEGCADPGTAIGLRAINSTPTALDVRAYLNTQVVTVDVTRYKRPNGGTPKPDTTITRTTTVNNFTLPATPTWANLAGMSVSTCVTMPVTAYPFVVVTQGPIVINDTTTVTTRTVTTTPTIKYNVQLAGGGAYVATDVSALIGIPNGVTANGCFVGTDCDQTPGSTTAGAVMTGIIFPPSIAGTKAAQFTSPAVSFMWDRRPPRNPGT